jgi:hypothetical protein
MAGNIYMGYMGWAKINGNIWKISGSSINPTQAINAPQLIQGDYTKKAWNYGPVEVGGNLSGPSGETSFPLLWALGSTRGTTGDRLLTAFDIEIQYVHSQSAGGADKYRKFAKCQINSIGISVTAGDVANLTIDFLGGQSDWGVASNFGVTTGAGTTAGTVACERLITWDQCEVNGSGFGVTSSCIESWDITLNNNLTRAYSLGQNHYYPIQILAGIKEFTGSLGVYAPNAPLAARNTAPFFGADKWADYSATGVQLPVFRVGATNLFPTGITVVTQRTEASAATGPSIYTVRFEGVCTY